MLATLKKVPPYFSRCNTVGRLSSRGRRRELT